jgi:hypothetical protein
MGMTSFPPESLLWPLNEQEQKFAPPELFVVGDADLLRAGACVAIVGSRKASPAGLDRARKLADLLVKRDVIVVSGLAAGIDTAAHATAIDSAAERSRSWERLSTSASPPRTDPCSSRSCATTWPCRSSRPALPSASTPSRCATGRWR